MTKTMNEQMEEIEAEMERNESYYYSTQEWNIANARKSQLQTDMKIRDEDISRLDETWKKQFAEAIEKSKKDELMFLQNTIDSGNNFDIREQIEFRITKIQEDLK